MLENYKKKIIDFYYYEVTILYSVIFTNESRTKSRQHNKRLF